MEMCDLLMAFNQEEGHEIAEQIVYIIEAKRCKHDRIEVLERNAAVWKQRAQASERQLNERIKELEGELELFNNLEATIHGIATRQQHLQPDSEEQLTILKENDEQRDPEREHVLAVLAGSGISPYNGDDDTEQGNTDEDEE